MSRPGRRSSSRFLNSRPQGGPATAIRTDPARRLVPGATKPAGSFWGGGRSPVRAPGSASYAEQWAQRIERGLVRIATVTRLEVGYSARSAKDARSMLAHPPLSAMPVQYLTPATEERAVEVQLLLAGQGQHRAPSLPDVLIAATAELAGLTVLHLDKDFELIAGITGQPTERLQT